MAAIDVEALEAQMRISSLDHLRDYSQDHYAVVKQYHETEYVPRSQAAGYQILREPLWNKGMTDSSMPNGFQAFASSCNGANIFTYLGTSFTPDERISMNLTGLIPHVLESMDTQCQRALGVINSRGTNIDKYLYLSSLKASNIDLFYRLLIDHVAQMMPLIYTPTIGDVCLQYSTLYTRPEALYISIKQRKSIATILRNWDYPDPSICVVTDGSRILGLGDLGVNGVGISVCMAKALLDHAYTL